MDNNYTKLVNDNLNKLYKNFPKDLARNLPGIIKNTTIEFKAFGESCQISPDGISFGKKQQTGVLGILISLYALNTCSEVCIFEPLKAFKEFPNSMPYIGAFATHTENILVSHVNKVEKFQDFIVEKLMGKTSPSDNSGDFSFSVQPLPKITLHYIFYFADDDFPASVTCLYSNNANRFLPMDALADVGEYTSKKILDLIE